LAEQSPGSLSSGEMPKPQNKDRERLWFFAVCGIFAPIFFTVMVAIEGALVVGYSHVSRPISDLGAYALYGSYSILQDINFWAFGGLVVALAIGLRRALPDSRRVTVSLVIFGLMIILAGVFQDEPSPWPGAAHSLVSVAAFISVILSQLFTWRRLRLSESRGERGWDRYGRLSVVTAILTMALFVAYGVFGQPGSATGGLVQRTFLAVPWTWIEVMSLGLFRHSK
jgi:hypothetical membrane protein